MKRIRKGRILIFLCGLFSISAFGQTKNNVEIKETADKYKLSIISFQFSVLSLN
jgi:hypothetical protein